MMCRRATKRFCRPEPREDFRDAKVCSQSFHALWRDTALAQQLLNSCVAQGGKSWDHSAMVNAVELMAAHRIA
jgi:3-hydroxyisobutyrate dehydrogenase-like beta-hydroxyacid dehydrogenase